MTEKFLREILEDTPALSPDAQVILRAIYAFENRTREREAAHNAQTAEQIDHLTETQRELQRSVEQVVAGFPDGNPDGHRRYHESVIKRQEMRDAMMRDALIQTAKFGAVGLIGWMAYAIWSALKLEIAK